MTNFDTAKNKFLAFCRICQLSCGTVMLTTSLSDCCNVHTHCLWHQLKPSVHSAVSSLSKLTCEQRC